MNHLKAAADVVLTASRFPKGHSAGMGDTKIITCHPTMPSYRVKPVPPRFKIKAFPSSLDVELLSIHCTGLNARVAKTDNR